MSIDTARTALFAAIDARQDELIAIVEDLVRFPSTLGNERPAQEYVAAHLAASGLKTELWELDEAVKEQPNAGESGVPFAGRPNVSAYRAGAGGGKSLILNGHIDVVSAEPVELWETDPYVPTRIENRLYGRGAWDMKSGVAMNLFLARLISELDIPLQGDLTIQSVIEEECTGNGALAAALRDRADAALITESTGQTWTHTHVGVMVQDRHHRQNLACHASVGWRERNRESDADHRRAEAARCRSESGSASALCRYRASDQS